ncbi:hypothetical protein PLESTM_000743000, partial [Pleodorina starrii]
MNLGHHRHFHQFYLYPPSTYGDSRSRSRSHHRSRSCSRSHSPRRHGRSPSPPPVWRGAAAAPPPGAASRAAGLARDPPARLLPGLRGSSPPVPPSQPLGRRDDANRGRGRGRGLQPLPSGPAAAAAVGHGGPGGGGGGDHLIQRAIPVEVVAAVKRAFGEWMDKEGPRWCSDAQQLAAQLK